MHRSKQSLLNHLIRAAEQWQRDGQAERLGALHINDQLDFGGLLDRQVGWLFAFQNPAGVQHLPGGTNQ
jgi:hypothetical protein